MQVSAEISKLIKYCDVFSYLLAVKGIYNRDAADLRNERIDC